MQKYKIWDLEIDSIELKCLLVSKGIKVEKSVYRAFSSTNRLNINPLMCNCLILPDGTIVQLTDVSFHLNYLAGILSWNNIKLLKYASKLGTPFSLKVWEDEPALFYEGEFICSVKFPPKTDFYHQKTSSGLPFLGNTVLQGLDWVAFQCLWPCEYAIAGKPCEFCFSGADFQACAQKKKPLPPIPSSKDVAEIVQFAIEKVGCNSLQLTGGSTFNGETEAHYITEYLNSINSIIGRDNIKGELLLYITPPSDHSLIDTYFELGVSRIGCSIEVWDESRAKIITPGKYEFTTRKRHLDALEYIANNYGPGKGFSNFIIGIEDFETLKEGATYLAERGILPTASVWMPFGRPVMGSMSTPNVDYFRRVKELFAELYSKYNLEPPASQGLNVCIERDIWNYCNTQYQEHLGNKSLSIIN